MLRRVIHNRIFWAAGVIGLALGLYLAFAVFGVHTLFYDEVVNEKFVVDAGSAAEKQESQKGASASNIPSGSTKLEEISGPVLISSGRFRPVAHPGTGDAIVYRQEDGSYVLRLENLDIFNGPALYVYAVAASDVNDSSKVLDAGFVNAGPLKGNKGNQTYPLPAGFDPGKHRSISIWCRRFSVNFATASLTPASSRTSSGLSEQSKLLRRQGLPM